MNSHAKAFLRLARQLERLREKTQLAKINAGLGDMPPGKYIGFTVYEVKESTVKRHKRRGFVAVRRNKISV